MSLSRDSAPALSKTVCMNFRASPIRHTMKPDTTTFFFSRVRNSAGGGVRTNSRASYRVMLWTGTGNLTYRPGAVTTRTGLPNWVTTATSPALTTNVQSDPIRAASAMATAATRRCARARPECPPTSPCGARVTSQVSWAKGLAEEDAGRVARPAGDLADDLVALSPVEVWSLVLVSVELHLGASAPRDLPLGRGEQPRADPAAAEILADPERLDEAGAAPRPAMEPGFELALCV